ncbi:MAG: NTP transferase domain-containing protein [Acidimicrobiia bacterium]
MSVAFVLLAAGEGSRWDGPGHKLMARVGTSTVIDLALSHAAQGFPDELIVVQGAVDLTEAVAGRATVVVNDVWSQGQGSSLELAIGHCRDMCHKSLVIGLGDQPWLDPRAWRAIATSGTRPMAVALYGDRRGHPIRLDAEVWPLLDLSADEGARALLRDRPELVEAVPCPGNPADIDTMGDLHRWSSSTNSP